MYTFSVYVCMSMLICFYEKSGWQETEADYFMLSCGVVRFFLGKFARPRIY